MKLTFKEYIDSIPTEDRVKIVADWKVLASTGKLGDCTLRAYAEAYEKESNIRIPLVTLMNEIALFCAVAIVSDVYDI